MRNLFYVAFAASLCVFSALAQQPKRKLDVIDSSRVHAMLRQAYVEVKKNYYDPTFHGVDLDARFKEYDAKLNGVGSLGEGFRVIAAFMTGLHDSHLFFMPPGRAASFDTGYRMQMVGDHCFVTRVRPGSDAASKVRPGDEVVKFNSFAVGRQDLHEMEYYFHTLAPSASEQLELKMPDGSLMASTIRSTVKPLKRSLDLDNDSDVGRLLLDEENGEDLTRERWVEIGDATIWKMAQFQADEQGVDGLFETARKHGTLIFDLRGNPGGAIDTLQFVLGHLFSHDVQISQRVGRKEKKPQVAKGSKHPYTGKVIVLVDSKSASSSELFARVVQLEKRGVVLGDTSAGAVMESRHFTETSGGESMIFYALSITDANLIMADGKSLEGVGVTPDEVIVPTAKDLAEGADPVMVRAAAMAGVNVDGVAAGKMFPYVWPTL